MRRESVRTLDGVWDFAVVGNFFDADVLSGGFNEKIRVPFCPESVLSGIGRKEFFTHCKYRRRFRLHKEAGTRWLLHFGAVDYEAAVYVNGTFVCRHIGGYTPFSADITDALREGRNELTVLVHDDVRTDSASGKQTDRAESYGCYYTRVTGIWQSVWLERVPEFYIRSVHFAPDASASAVCIRAEIAGKGTLHAQIFYRGRCVGEGSTAVEHRTALTVPLSEVHPWGVGRGELYDVRLTFGEDAVESYFGIRTFECRGNAFYLNGMPVFLRLVLDQGYDKEGIYTTPNRRRMGKRIRMAQALGFHGARLHQKIFEPAFLYECDRRGYLVWEEYPSWGTDFYSADRVGDVFNEWREAMERDMDHPSVIVWCPANESWNDAYRGRSYVRECSSEYLRLLYAFTVAVDASRPCLTSSGGIHTDTDIYDFHDYGSAERLREVLACLSETGELPCPFLAPKGEQPCYGGQPVVCSEYGGRTLCAKEGWGYARAEDADAWMDEICAMTRTLMESDVCAGLCYTQLYDVEQEQNGLYTYDNVPKFTKEQGKRLRAVLRRRASIEK